MDNSRKDKIDINELVKKAKSGTKLNTSNDINNFINENLSSQQANAVKQLLKDEEKTKALLNSDAAKTLFKKFFGGEENG